MELRTQARSMLRKMKLLQEKIKYLADQREIELAKLKNSKKIVLVDEEKQKVLIAEVHTGVVSAISFDKNNVFCMVDGVDEILKAGDTIEAMDIEVVAIGNEQVTFSKKGRQWQQKLGAEADKAWK
jgi:hypothetical protein